MKAPLTLFGFCWLAACGQSNGSRDTPAPAPPLPPVSLSPFVTTLKELATSAPTPAPAHQKELQELGDIALQIVEADSRTSARAERALLEHPRLDFVLEPALVHTEVGIRRRAAWLAGQSGQSFLQLPLLLRLKYELDPETVLWVADALQRLGNDAGLGWLDAAMDQSTTAETAGGLAIAICKERNLPLSEPPTYAELQRALRQCTAAWRKSGSGGRPGVVAPTTAAVEPRLATHLATTEGTLLRPVDDARFVLTRSGRLALPLLGRTLAASEPYLRTMALQVLADLGLAAGEIGHTVMPLLADALTEPYAVRTLGEIGATEAIPHLRTRLRHHDTEIRCAAAIALGLLADVDTGPALDTMLGNATEALDVRVGAAFGLLCLGNHAAAEAFLVEREQKGDYHPQTLARLRERLRARALAMQGK